MATAEAIQLEIESAQRMLQDRTDASRIAMQEIIAANERQRLRRQLDGIRDAIDRRNRTISQRNHYRVNIDQDIEGEFMPDATVTDHHAQLRDAGRDTSKGGLAARDLEDFADCRGSVLTGEMEWTITGMSWLKSSLKQVNETWAAGATFEVGGESFELVYNPDGSETMSHRLGPDVYSKGTLAVRHISLDCSEGITFRHTFFVQRGGASSSASSAAAGGGGGASSPAREYVQWGATGEECHVNFDTLSWVFGPDIVEVPESNDRTVPAGIFNLNHEALLRSEWVHDDTLTVKVKLEVRDPAHYRDDVQRRDDNNLTRAAPPPVIDVPPPTLACDFLGMLEQCGGDDAHNDDDAAGGDVTFFVEGERIRAHACVLCARSEVFARELNGSMLEATSREVTIEECDALTFRALLRFLYTDDLERVDTWIYEQTTRSAAARSPSTSPRDGGGARGRGCAGGDGDSDDSAASAASSSPSPARESDPEAMRIALLQGVLAASHRYQISRLRLWCEQRLAGLIGISTVCGLLCQGHLFEAEQLEAECLKFIGEHVQKVCVTPSFGELSAEWPAVMLKINLHLAGVQANDAAPAIEAQAAAAAHGIKRKRESDAAAAAADDEAAVGARSSGDAAKK